MRNPPFGKLTDVDGTHPHILIENCCTPPDASGDKTRLLAALDRGDDAGIYQVTIQDPELSGGNGVWDGRGGLLDRREVRAVFGGPAWTDYVLPAGDPGREDRWRVASRTEVAIQFSEFYGLTQK
jgi:hypothetical protein